MVFLFKFDTVWFNDFVFFTDNANMQFPFIVSSAVIKQSHVDTNLVLFFTKFVRSVCWSLNRCTKYCLDMSLCACLPTYCSHVSSWYYHTTPQWVIRGLDFPCWGDPCNPQNRTYARAICNTLQDDPTSSQNNIALFSQLKMVCLASTPPPPSPSTHLYILHRERAGHYETKIGSQRYQSTRWEGRGPWPLARTDCDDIPSPHHPLVRGSVTKCENSVYEMAMFSSVDSRRDPVNWLCLLILIIYAGMVRLNVTGILSLFMTQTWEEILTSVCKCWPTYLFQ